MKEGISLNDCEHDKRFIFLLSNPPIKKWECNKCGDKGIEGITRDNGISFSSKDINKELLNLYVEGR